MKPYLFLIWLAVMSCTHVPSPESSGIYTNSPGDSKYHLDILGKNTWIFDPQMDMEEVQEILDSLFHLQSIRGSEFNYNRFAIYFKPGKYKLDIKVAYYMQVCGLGSSPGDVIIIGAIRSNSLRNHVLTNFWRGVENLTIIPADTANVWGVSQAAPMRRVHVKGNLKLHDKGYASGGFLADCMIDGEVSFGPQQQFFSRNCSWESYYRGAWNILSLGVKGAPESNWPEGPYTSIERTPLNRQKPFLVYEQGKYVVYVPEPEEETIGPAWMNNDLKIQKIALSEFYIANPENDTPTTINKALSKGKHLLFTPGLYEFDESIIIGKPGTIVLGLGMPSLTPLKGNVTMKVTNSNGLILSGLLFDAGLMPSETLLEIGSKEQSVSQEHSWLFDIFSRVGGPSEGSVKSCVVVNSDKVIIDHIWLWRADHGEGVGWDKNRSENGIIVNGDDVTVYGLFNEHHQGYQTVWNGESGRVYLYQSEMPYDLPASEYWMNGDVEGFATYKVAGHVKTHEAWGLGFYCYFRDAAIRMERGAEVPVHLEDYLHHKFTYWLNGNRDSEIKHVVNDKGEAATPDRKMSALE